MALCIVFCMQGFSSVWCAGLTRPAFRLLDRFGPGPASRKVSLVIRPQVNSETFCMLMHNLVCAWSSHP